jgi:hypothetical protein
MSEPIALCIEDCNALSEAAKYVRCVAAPAGTPGLALDANGEVKWKSGDPVACTLWVSDDDCLILHRAAGASNVALQRAGRMLDVPMEKPVKVLDQDQIYIGPRHLRIHIHGQTNAVLAPTGVVQPIDAPAQPDEAAAYQAAIEAQRRMQELKLLEMRQAMDEIELRDHPPLVVQIRPESSDRSDTLAELQRLAKEKSEIRKLLELSDIKVREHPPEMELKEPEPKKPRRPDDKKTKGGSH